MKKTNQRRLVCGVENLENRQLLAANVFASIPEAAQLFSANEKAIRENYSEMRNENDPSEIVGKLEEATNLSKENAFNHSENLTKNKKPPVRTPVFHDAFFDRLGLREKIPNRNEELNEKNSSSEKPTQIFAQKNSLSQDKDNHEKRAGRQKDARELITQIAKAQELEHDRRAQKLIENYTQIAKTTYSSRFNELYQHAQEADLSFEEQEEAIASLNDLVARAQHDHGFNTQREIQKIRELAQEYYSSLFDQRYQDASETVINFKDQEEAIGQLNDVVGKAQKFFGLEMKKETQRLDELVQEVFSEQFQRVIDQSERRHRDSGSIKQSSDDLIDLVGKANVYGMDHLSEEASQRIIDLSQEYFTTRMTEIHKSLAESTAKTGVKVVDATIEKRKLEKASAAYADLASEIFYKRGPDNQQYTRVLEALNSVLSELSRNDRQDDIESRKNVIPEQGSNVARGLTGDLDGDSSKNRQSNDNGWRRPNQTSGTGVDYGQGRGPNVGSGLSQGSDSGNTSTWTSGGNDHGSGGGSSFSGQTDNTLDGERDPNKNNDTSHDSSSTANEDTSESQPLSEDTSSNDDTGQREDRSSSENVDNKKWSAGETADMSFSFGGKKDCGLPPNHPDAALGNEQLKERFSEWSDFIDQHWDLDQEADQNSNINWGDEGRTFWASVTDGTSPGSGGECFTGVPKPIGGSGPKITGGNQGGVDAPGDILAGLPSDYCEMRWLNELFRDAGSFGPGSGQGSGENPSQEDETPTEQQDDDSDDQQSENDDYLYVTM